MKQNIFSLPALFWGLSLSLLAIAGAISNAMAEIHNVEIVDDVTGEYMFINADGASLDADPALLLTKSANKSVVNVGEEVIYTIRLVIDDLGFGPPPDPDPLTGTASAIVFTLLNLTDSLPDNEIMEMVGMQPSTGMTCQSDAEEIRCQISDAELYDEYELTSTFIAKNPGTATNSIEVRDQDNVIQGEVEANVLVQDPGNVFVVTADPNKSVIELGEDVIITTTITNRTESETLTDINFEDVYDSDLLQFVSLASDTDVICSSDSQKIQCHIEELEAQQTRTITTTYQATDTGMAINKMTLTSAKSQALNFEASVQIGEADIESLLLTSPCEGRNLFIGDRCALTVTTQYEFTSDQDVSINSTFNGFQAIGNMAENILTVSEQGEALITAQYEGVNSNTIRLVATDGVAAGRDLDGNIVSHFAARIGAGKDVVNAYNNPITVGTIEADNTVVARNNKITFSDMVEGEVLDWFLEDSSFGVIRDANTDGECSPLEGGIICRGKQSISFDSKEKQGSVLLRVTDTDGNARNMTIHLVEPSVESVEIVTVNGAVPEATIYNPQENISLTSKSTLVSGEEKENTQDKVDWEFKRNGGEWSSQSEEGSIHRGVFTPLIPGTFVVRAKAVQNLAMPGVNFLTQRTFEVFSQEIAIQVGAPVAYVESMRTQGNEGMAKGTADVLFVRLRHVGGMDEIHDMELNIIKGIFAADEEIPASAQHFSITVVPEEIYSEKQDTTLLLQIPFFIPEIDDIKDGAHTLQLVINGNNGLVTDMTEGRLGVFVGEPQAGDGDLDGKISLVDAVIAMRIAEGNVDPSGLQMLGYDVDRDNVITLRDILEIFQKFLSEFLT